MAIVRLCSHIGCPRPRVEGHKYCVKHMEEDEARDNERYIRYLNDKYSSSKSRLPEDKQNFYNTRKWREMRRNFLMDNPYCVYCGALADQVHHNYPPKTNYFNDEMFFDTDHWQSVCADCHRRLRK